MTIGDFEQNIWAFCDYLHLEKNYSNHTVEAYRADLKQFISFASSHNSISQNLDYALIRTWMVTLAHLGLSHRTINRKTSAIKSFYNFLKKTGIIQNHPMHAHKTLKAQKRIQIPFNKIELSNLINQQSQNHDYESYRDLLIILLFYTLGLRRKELINLTITSIDFQNNTIKVLGKGDKYRILPLPSELRNALHEYLRLKNEVNFEQSSGYLFVTSKGVKLYENFVYRLIKKYLSEVTLKDKKSPHMLRHSFATHMLENGADLNSIKEILGHSSLAATQHYLHTSTVKLKEAHKKNHPRNRKTEF